MKATKGIRLLKYLVKYVSRRVLDLSYELYVRPHLDYCDVIYHNQRDDLMKLIEQVQYKAGLIVSGCCQGTSRERLYEERGWESLSERRWSRRMTIFYKIRFDNSFFPYCISNWNLLDSDIKSLSTLCEFKDKICKFYRLKGILFIKYVIRMELNF